MDEGKVGKYHDSVNQKKRELILEALRRSHGNFTEAAKLLDLHPNYLHRLVRQFGLRADIDKA